MSEALPSGAPNESTILDVALVRRKMREWAAAHPRYAIFEPRDPRSPARTSWGPWPEVGIKLYKTARNALAYGGVDGVLVHMDFEQLRIVDASETLVTKGDARNEIGDSEFCERQAVLWMQRAEALKADGR